MSTVVFGTKSNFHIRLGTCDSAYLAQTLVLHLQAFVELEALELNLHSTL
jgi:hypothetical protein